MKAGKIGLLILILAFGGIIESAWAVRNSIGIGPSGCRVLRGRFYGPSFTFDAEARQTVPAGASLEVENAFGGVRVIPGAPGEVRVSLRKVVFQPSEEKARAFAERVRIEQSLEGSVLRVGTNRRELEFGRNEVGFETHMEISVPPDTPVKVQAEHGAVDVADAARADINSSFDAVRVERVKGPVAIDTRHGDVHVSHAGEAVSLTVRFGDTEVQDVAGTVPLVVEHGEITADRVGALNVTAQHSELRAVDVKGDLDVHGQHTPVDVTGVTGHAVVETSFGDVTLRRVTGEMRAHTEHGSVEAMDVGGAATVQASFDDVVLDRIGGPVDVTIEHGGLRAKDLAKGARARVSGDEVVLDGFHGPVDVQVQRAGIELIPAGALTDAVTATAAHGGIRLQVPRESRFALQASAAGGEVQVDVPGLVLTRTDTGHATGTLGGGGSAVTLTVEHGDVRVEAAAAPVAAKNP